MVNNPCIGIVTMRDASGIDSVGLSIPGQPPGTAVHQYLSSDTLEKPRHSGSLFAGLKRLRFERPTGTARTVSEANNPCVSGNFSKSPCIIRTFAGSGSAFQKRSKNLVIPAVF